MQARELAIHEIDPDAADSRRFRHRLAPPPSALSESIRRDGLLCPLIVLETAGAFALVSGFRRLAACRRCGVERIAVRVAPADRDPIELLGLAVRENLAVGGLTEAERLLVLARYAQLGAEAGWILSHAAEPLGFAARASVLHRAMEVAQLPAEVLDAVAAGRMDWGHVRLLAELPPDDAAAAAELLEAVRLTVQQARGVLESLAAVAAGEQQPFALLAAEMVESARQGRPADRAAAGRLIELLSERRYPRRTAAWRRLEAALAALELPAGVQVAADRTMEDDRLHVTLRAAEAAGLARRLAALAAEVGEPPWREVFGALRCLGEPTDA